MEICGHECLEICTKQCIVEVEQECKTHLLEICAAPSTKSELIFNFKFEGELVAFAATDLRFGDLALDLFAERADTHAALENGSDRAVNDHVEFHVMAGVRPDDLGDGAGTAQVTRPCLALGLQQTTLLDISAAIIIAIKVEAFFSGRCFHRDNLYARYVFACASINPDRISDINEVGALDGHAGFSCNFLGHACGSVATDGHFSLDHFQIHRGG